MPRHAMTAMVLLLWARQVISCGPPLNLAGMLFNDGEEVVPARIADLGTEGLDYIKDSQTNGVTYYFRLFSDSTVCAFVGNTGVSYLGDRRINCAGVMVESLESARTGNYDFTALAADVVTWLVHQGIVEVRVSRLNELISNMQDINDSELSAVTGGGMQGFQYWTRQDTAIPYNKWFDSTGSVQQIQAHTEICAVIDVFFTPLSEPLSVRTGRRPWTKAGSFFRGNTGSSPAVINVLGRKLRVNCRERRSYLPHGVYILSRKRDLMPTVGVWNMK